MFFVLHGILFWINLKELGLCEKLNISPYEYLVIKEVLVR